MDDDSPDLSSRIARPIGRYAELYPDIARRLKSILATREPGLRRRLTQLEAIARQKYEANCERVTERYGLTAAEARVALHLAEGGDIASCAAEAGVSQGTVRVQLKSIFAKTGVNRQAALLRLLQTPF